MLISTKATLLTAREPHLESRSPSLCCATSLAVAFVGRRNDAARRSRQTDIGNADAPMAPTIKTCLPQASD